MKLTDHCYAVTGLYFSVPWNINAGFIVGGKKTLIIDSGSNTGSAQTIYGYAKIVKPDNELLLINTEQHLDHIGGNGYFSEKGVSLYGHASIQRNQNELSSMLEEINSGIANTVRREHREGFIAFKNTAIVNPDKKIDHDMELGIGGMDVQVMLTPGHTPSNISIYQRDENVLYCGDCILPEFIPNLEEGTIPDWQSWLASLEKIQRLDIKIMVPGHGNVLTEKTNIGQEIERIKNIIDIAIQNKKAPTTTSRDYENLS
jgi:glyoxylase-like metal-dependent hydrolase (beta-lactamase superfamily II)